MWCGAVRSELEVKGKGEKRRGRRYFEEVALVRVGGEVGAREDDLVFEAGVVAVEVVAFCWSMASAYETTGSLVIISGTGWGVTA